MSSTLRLRIKLYIFFSNFFLFIHCDISLVIDQEIVDLRDDLHSVGGTISESAVIAIHPSEISVLNVLKLSIFHFSYLLNFMRLGAENFGGM